MYIYYFLPETEIVWTWIEIGVALSSSELETTKNLLIRELFLPHRGYIWNNNVGRWVLLSKLLLHFSSDWIETRNMEQQSVYVQDTFHEMCSAHSWVIFPLMFMFMSEALNIVEQTSCIFLKRLNWTLKYVITLSVQVQNIHPFISEDCVPGKSHGLVCLLQSKLWGIFSKVCYKSVG